MKKRDLPGVKISKKFQILIENRARPYLFTFRVPILVRNAKQRAYTGG